MIDSLQLASLASDAAPRREKVARDDGAQGFSYALAAASLERNAAKSLEVHGARPEGSGAAQPKTPAVEGDANNARVAARDISHSPQGSKTSVANDNAQQLAQRSITPPTQPTHQTVTAAATEAQGANAPTVSTIKPAAMSAAREAAADKMKSAATKAPRLPSAPASLKAEFTEILAKRLEKTSIFDLRLDPPELGRVEGRLAVDDNGKAVLSLTFDSREGFNHFSRDEAALRLALQQAGLQFDAGDFVFAFKERGSSEALSFAADAPAALSASSAAYDPQFFADWSAGALDIRI